MNNTAEAAQLTTAMGTPSLPSLLKIRTAEDVAGSLAAHIRGKNVFITGVTVGSLGGEVLRVIAPYASIVWIAGRSEDRLNAAAEEARSAESADIRNVLLDLTSFASIKSGVQPVLASGLPIDVLILNAAAPTGTLDKRTMTQDGWEMHWGMNHLGHFLLTALLLPQLQNRPSSGDTSAEFPRIIVVSSRAHRASAIRFDDVNFSSRPEEYAPAIAYAASKTANILFTRELARRLKAGSSDIHAFSLTPGRIMSNGVKDFSLESMVKLGAMRPDGSRIEDGEWRTIEEGTATHIYAGFDPSLRDYNGSYLKDCAVHDELLSEHARNDEDAKRLWEMSEQAIGMSIPIQKSE